MASIEVQSGDTLGTIAQRVLQDSSRWREIYDMNRGEISDPDLIFAGQRLYIPSV
jgi:nucleoid-associated protein YgaU